MDLSFNRSGNGTNTTGTPDLQSLLAAAAERQSSSPTARAAADARDKPYVASQIDPRIGMFAAENIRDEAGSCFGSFSTIADKIGEQDY